MSRKAINGQSWKSESRAAPASAARLMDLHDRDGLTFAMIAERFGRSESSVRRAVQKHRRLIAEARP